MFQEDSLSVRPSTVRHSGQLTPQQVLSQLPGNATPAQQDSAIQQHIKASPIHWSNRPDTLHLPGQPVGKSFRNIDLPKYYKESFFSGDSLFHPELPGGRRGVAGDPILYSISGDNLITSLLLGCFVLAIRVSSSSDRLKLSSMYRVKTPRLLPRRRANCGFSCSWCYRPVCCFPFFTSFIYVLTYLQHSSLSSMKSSESMPES